MNTIDTDKRFEAVLPVFEADRVGLISSSGARKRKIEPEIQRSRPRFKAYGARHIHRIRQLHALSRGQRDSLKIASLVMPFRVNDYVLDELIDWSDIPSDPIFQLTFPQIEMLQPHDSRRLQNLVGSAAAESDIQRCARSIQMRMNPHPAGQMELNVPSVDGEYLLGCQHKYRETVLIFPPAGQTCHAFCTYCFRWPQFVGIERLRFALHEVHPLIRYLRRHTEVTDVLVTGGDPLIMTTSVLRRYLETLLDDRLEHVTSIRVGTKSLAYWPYRFTTDRDADDLLRLFEEVRKSGRQLALMAHFSHPRELSTKPAQRALGRIRNTGAVVRCQAPLIRHVNDSSRVWADMWREQVRLGTVPYYMFIARDTGPRAYFEVPLAEAWQIYSNALARVSGLARTIRGPVMSAAPGKILVEGITAIDGQKAFVLKMIQGRDPAWVNRVFLARFDPRATWLDQLQPAFDEPEFFFEHPFRDFGSHRRSSDGPREPETPPSREPSVAHVRGLAEGPPI